MKENLLSINPSVEGGGVIFHGEVNLISYSQLCTLTGFTNSGSLNTSYDVDIWLSFTVDDKNVYTPKSFVRQQVGYDDIYKLGLAYGRDDNGFPPLSISGVDQLKIITINGKDYKVRLAKRLDPGLESLSTSGYDVVGTQQSEWSRLFYPIVADDPFITSYKGPKLADYTLSQLWFTSVPNRNRGCMAWCQEYSNNLTNRFIPGLGGIALAKTHPSNYNHAECTWRPILEEIIS